MTTLRRPRLRRPVAIQRFLVIFLTIAAMRISLCHTGSRVAAHGMGRYSTTLWPNKKNDYRKRRRPSFDSRFSFSKDCCLRIQRGGANRFVNDDGNESSSSNNNEISESTPSKNRMPASKGRHSPVVYQYFGKSRSRGSFQSSDESPLNFILLGPNVDHWKAIGQTLASRGFNVMACERMVEDPPGETTKATNYEDAPDLVLEILDALKWEKAVLVGCDDESELAMETALMLAPDRVAGLILCGDLKKANQFAEEMGRVRVLDSFLHRYLDCPFVIIWDGGARSIVSGSSAHEAIESKSSPFDGENRCVILGGGSAPHRTKPEYFAWVLARFVEERLEFHSRRPKQRTPLPDSSSSSTEQDNNPKQFRARILQNLNLPFGIDSLVSPEGRLLLGRAVAAAIFYTSVMKVIFIQYGILRMGLSSLKNSVDSVDALRRKIFQATGAFIWNFGYLPRLFKFSLKRTKDLDEDEIGSSDSATDPPEQEENGEITLDSPSTNLDEDEDENEDENEDEDEDSRKEDEDEDSEDSRRVKIRFLLDNFFA